MRKVRLNKEKTGYFHNFLFDGSALIEIEDGSVINVSRSDFHFMDKPEDDQLTKMVTELVAGAIANNGGKGSEILYVERAVRIAKEIIRQTK